MTNILEEHLEGLVTKYQDSNRRNAPRIGKALGRLSGVIVDIEKKYRLSINDDLSDYRKKILLDDLRFIYNQINLIEL
tara:strand:+ start:2821 stop:3054 length:234 start_codon:yes stop_codon:yes gene_type:complete